MNIKTDSKLKEINDKRLQSLELLKHKNWFKKTSPTIKEEIISLSSDFNGFIHDLATRPEIIGSVEVIKLLQLLVGNYLVIPVFQVRSLLTNELYTYEYASWKHGKYTGYKGILLIEVEGQVKFFVLRKSIKFPTAGAHYEALGTFEAGFSTNRLLNFSRSIDNQLKKTLGVSEISLKRYIDLGLFNPDAGMSNQNIALFAGVISLQSAEILEKQIDTVAFRKLNPGYEIEIHPIERLLEFVSKSDDGFFLACIARLSALNIIRF